MPHETAGKQRCSAVTLKGAQCRGTAMAGQDVCPLHSPAAVEGRRLGGLNSSHVARGMAQLPPSLRDVADMLALGIQQTRDGTMKPQVMTAMGAGTTALLKVVEVAVLQSQLTELRGQVAELLATRAQEVERPL